MSLLDVYFHPIFSSLISIGLYFHFFNVQTNDVNGHVSSGVEGTDVAAAQLQVDLDDSVKLLLVMATLSRAEDAV